MPPPPVVLLVEDHADTRELYAAVLMAAGFDVIQAADATEALSMTQSVLPAVVVTDIWMPGPVSADDICRHFHGLGIPVLAVTAVAPGRAYEVMNRAGCAGFLLKPVELDSLVAEVRRLLAKGDQGGA